MWRKLILLAATLLVVLAAAADVRARTVGPGSISDLFAYSDLVALVRILEATSKAVDGEFCGVQYTAAIEHIFKGRHVFAPDDHLRFGRHFGLEPGATYLLFLRGYADAREIYDTMNLDIAPDSPEDREEVNRYIECGGIVPGYEYLAASRENGEGGIAIRTRDFSDIPNAVRIIEQEKRATIVSKRDLYLYLDQFGGADPFETLCADCPRNAALVPPPLRVRDPDKIRGSVI